MGKGAADYQRPPLRHRNRINRQFGDFRRAKRVLYRVAGDSASVEKLDAAYQGLVKAVNVRERFERESAAKYGRTPNAHRLEVLAGERRALGRVYRYLQRQLEGVLKTKTVIFKDCTLEEREAKERAILLIPQSRLMGLHKLSLEAQEQHLNELIAEYGALSKNGFSANLLNMPGHYASYLVNENREKDGSKARPIIIHEMIDRLIYAALHPESFKSLFFRPTAKNKEGERKLCKRWNDRWRQMRTEGRLGMVKVMIVLLYRTDVLHSLRAGIRHKDGKFSGIPISDPKTGKGIAELAGMSRSAVNTALASLVEMNILYPGKQPRDSFQNPTDADIRFKGLPVVRKFHLNLIFRLGLADKWRRERLKTMLKSGDPAYKQLLAELDALGEMTGSEYVRHSNLIDMKMALFGDGA